MICVFPMPMWCALIRISFASIMELLYKTSLPRSRVHCMTWSGMNLLALSISIEDKGKVAENYETASIHQLVVFDPNRPWDFHCVVPDCKTVVTHLDWSLDGTRLLALSDTGLVRVLRMRSQSINNWVSAVKQEPDPSSPDRVIHAAWLDYRPMVTIHHTKEKWSDVMEFQSFSPLLRMLLGNAFITITSSGKVVVKSTSLAHCGESEDQTSGGGGGGAQESRAGAVLGELKAETTLPGVSKINIAKTFVTQTGSILCGVGCEGGQLKVFSLTASLCWSNEFTLSATMATELHQMASKSDRITGLLMLPHSDGCVVHVCYNGTQLYQWSVKDITRSSSYQSRREGVHSSSHSISCLAGSALCLGSHDPSATESKMSELLELGLDMKEGENKWPVEVLVTVGERGEVTIFNRESYNELCTSKPDKQDQQDSEYPAAKRRRVESSGVTESDHILTLSPNSCCIAVASGEHVYVYQTGGIILGCKDADPSTPEIPRCSRLLSLATVSALSPWDLAVTISRLEVKQGGGFVKKVLDHFVEDFEKNSSSQRSLLLRHYLSVCSLLHSSLEDGLLSALSYRGVSRLHATSFLLNFCLPTNKKEEKWPLETLQSVCSNNSSEQNLETVFGEMDKTEFVISSDVTSQLQGHCHWLVEMAIQVVSAVAAGHNDIIPDSSCLELLRQNLLLIYTWNKALPQNIIPVTDGALSLLFKVLTTAIQSPSSPLSEELQSEVSSNIPTDKYPNLLTLTKAAHLQGFLSGLVSAHLPESFKRDMSPRIRPQVQSKFLSLDPYSPLTLVVPEGLSPPWKDCFVEGQKDVIHGGTLNKTVVQNAKLKQCSRCRSWTVASEGLQTDSTSQVRQTQQTSSNPVQQWRNAWTYTCLCGAPWTLRNNNKRT